jgi:hypothetical protein
MPTRPEHAYNDPLQLLYELGAGALLLFAVVILALEAPCAERLILLCFLEQSLFFFPLALPISAFFAAVTLGFLARQRDLHRRQRGHSGSALSDWWSGWRSALSRSGRQALPLESFNSNQTRLYGPGDVSIYRVRPALAGGYRS